MFYLESLMFGNLLLLAETDRETKGGLGVMGDDLLAGFFAGLLGVILIGIMQKIEALAPLLEFSF